MPFSSIGLVSDGVRLNSILVSPNSGIKTIKDLKGKTVALAKGTTSHVFLVKVLAKNGLKEKDLKIVNLPLPEAHSAFQGGKVDAWATIVYIPEDRVVYIGDFIIWTFPNVGNPNKVLRYAREWYETLDRVLSWQPRIIAPGHGPSLTEPEIIHKALRDTSDALRFLEEQTVIHINKGSSEETAILNIRLPEHLEQSPFLRQVCGPREFVIRGIYRRYTGWYNGNPTHLAPAPQEQVRQAVLDLIGDEDKILAKAGDLQAKGELQLALHIVDLLIGDSGKSDEAYTLKANLLLELADRSQNLFYHNYYKGSAKQLIQR
ncbi:hypothetical protein C2I18_03755 [Paenibacillus sp. PK3_47]|nr:hypothetical protein C2I18_03755 [Paenibacillus sp. PK3_47]